MSMRWQLLGAFGLIIVVALGTVALLAQYTARQEVESFLRHGGQEGLEAMSSSLENYYLENGTWSGVDSLFTVSPGRGRGQRAGENAERGDHVLTDAEGLVVYSAGQLNIGDRLTDEELGRSIPLKSSGEIVGYLLPEGGIPELPDNFESLLVARVNRATFLSALISGGVAVLLAVVFSAIILKPVRELTRAAEALSQGDLSQRVSVQGKGELASLGETFNDMAETLQEAEYRRKAMTADIAHELRNPLAIQRAHLEALQDGIYPLDRDQVDRLYSQNQHLSRLVEDLRLLAMADAGVLSLDKTRFDLAALCLKMMADFEPQIAPRNIFLEVAPQSSRLLIFADNERIKQIINNLMQNALRYTPEGGQIKVSFAEANGEIVLEIFNSGPQMSEETLNHLFERFYRGDRSRDRNAGGTGLGLAIAKKLAEVQGGSLTGKNHPQGGVVFVLTFPKAS